MPLDRPTWTDVKEEDSCVMVHGMLKFLRYTNLHDGLHNVSNQWINTLDYFNQSLFFSPSLGLSPSGLEVNTCAMHARVYQRPSCHR